MRGQGSMHRRPGSPPHRGADRNLNTLVRILGDYGRPLTGARIETIGGKENGEDGRVAPSRGRGSKRFGIRSHDADAPVAPSLGRGSKPTGAAGDIGFAESPPSRGRGSKQAKVMPLGRSLNVAPSRGRGSNTSSRPRPPGHAENRSRWWPACAGRYRSPRAECTNAGPSGFFSRSAVF
jgi:hypothetical protein